MGGIVYNKFYIWSFWTTFIRYNFCYLFRGFLVYILGGPLGPFFSPRILHCTIWKCATQAFLGSSFSEEPTYSHRFKIRLHGCPCKRSLIFNHLSMGHPNSFFVFNLRNMIFNLYYGFFMKEMAQDHHVSRKRNPNHCISILGSSRYLRKLPRQHFWF